MDSISIRSKAPGSLPTTRQQQTIPTIESALTITSLPEFKPTSHRATFIPNRAFDNPASLTITHPSFLALRSKCYLRSDKHILRIPLTPDELRTHRENARFPESLTDYDFIDLVHRGRCLCELLIITGSTCLETHGKFSGGAHAKAFENHWCWTIDNSPHKRLCPAHPDTPATPREILLPRARIKEFVSNPRNEPINMTFEGKCPVCLGMCVKEGDGTHRLDYDQGLKKDLVKMVIVPYRFVPEVDERGSVVRKYPEWLGEKRFLGVGWLFHSDWAKVVYPEMDLRDVWVDYLDVDGEVVGDDDRFGSIGEGNAMRPLAETLASTSVGTGSGKSKRTRDTSNDEEEDAETPSHKRQRNDESSRVPRIGLPSEEPDNIHYDPSGEGRSGLDFYHWTQDHRKEYLKCVAEFQKPDESMTEWFQDLVRMCRRKEEDIEDEHRQWP